jgi:exonuclease III
VRGLNSQDKWIGIRSKIIESNCDIICLQETKREVFDQIYLKKFCLAQFDYFEYIPSVGALGGMMITWKNARYSGNMIFQKDYAINIEFASTFLNAQWVLTNI